MVRGSQSRKGQVVIEDIKTVSIVLMVVFVLGAVVMILAIIGSNLDQGFAHVDGARMYSSVTGLSGEDHSVTRLQLLNDYEEIQVEGQTLTFRAGFLDSGSLDVDLPERYTYESAGFSGKNVCIIKRGTDITVRRPPCG